MFERFSDRARHALVAAREEAARLGHDGLGTEHMLLGLAAEADGGAAKALAAMEISPDAVRAKVVELFPPAVGGGAIEPPFTPEAKAALERSLHEVLELGGRTIGTAHLLLGILRDPACGGARVLAALGADASVLEAAVARTTDMQWTSLASPPKTSHASPAAATEPIVDPGPGVTPGRVPVEPAALVTWDDVEQLVAEAGAVERATAERAGARHVDYRVCRYEPRPPPSVAVSVAAAAVTAEAFRRTTDDRISEVASPVPGLGDQATFNPATGTVRVLRGSVAFAVSVRGGVDERTAATALARRALARLDAMQPDADPPPREPGVS